MYNKDKRKIACWGRGDVYKKCILAHPEFRPDVIVDSNPLIKSGEIKVISPNEINNYADYFFIITVSRQLEEIKNYLKERGLEEYKDYVGYDEYWEKPITTKESLLEIFELAKKTEDVTLVMGPFSLSRESEFIEKFLNKYAANHGDRDHILVDLTCGLDWNDKLLSKYHIVKAPYVCMYNGDNEKKYVRYETEVPNISEEELLWVKELEIEKKHGDRYKAEKITISIYDYFKRVLKIIPTKRVIFWGAWNRNYYIVKELCEKFSIQFVSMEFGWLPKTIQSGKETDVAREYEQYKKYLCENYKYKEILQQSNIYKNSGIINDKIEKKLNTINPNVLLVGISDEMIGFAQNSSYTNKYLSKMVKSSEHALQIMLDICANRKWNLIFKPHPIDKTKKIYEKYRDIDNLIFIDDNPIENLISESDVVVSIFSKVDYTTLLYKKPLVLLGNYCLSKTGACYVPNDIDELECVIEKAIQQGMTDEQEYMFNLHVQHLLSKYEWKTEEKGWGQDFGTDFFEEINE